MGSERQATEICEDQNAVRSLFQGDGAHRRPGRPDSPATAIHADPGQNSVWVPGFSEVTQQIPKSERIDVPRCPW